LSPPAGLGFGASHPLTEQTTTGHVMTSASRPARDRRRALIGDEPPPFGVSLWAWSDGAVVPADSLRMSPICAGMHYAATALEGVRAYDGVLFRVAEHADRLLLSAELLGLADGVCAGDVVEACQALLDADGGGDRYLRPVLWDDGGRLQLAGHRPRPRLAVLCAALPSVLAADGPVEPRPLRVLGSSWRRPAEPFAPHRVKGSATYAVSGMALRQARLLGFDDALLLDAVGDVCELTTSNVMAVVRGSLVTPPVGPALAGITRAELLDLADELGITTEERPMGPADLAVASEVLACGTGLEIRAVTELRVGSGELQYDVGDVCRALATGLRDRARAAAA
jgi:branched-chain amino acid aminotransferase